MKLFATLNGLTGSDKPQLSGGDVRLLEILQRMPNHWQLTISTTAVGRSVCNDRHIKAVFALVPDPSGNLVLSNFIRVLGCLRSFLRLKADISYSGSELLYDVLGPALARVLWGQPWAAVVHMTITNPWSSSGENKQSLLSRYANWLQLTVAQALIFNFADQVLAVSPHTYSEIALRIKRRSAKLKCVRNGVSETILHAPNTYYGKHDFAAMFLGRLTPVKGALDLPYIWKHVSQLVPDARLLIVGSGLPHVISQMKETAKRVGVGDLIDFYGQINDDSSKLELFNRSACLILPSRKENWSIVIGEAVANGLPVVAYDLANIRTIWNDDVRWIPLGDYLNFAIEIVKYYKSMQIRGRQLRLIDMLDWNKIAQEEVGYLQEIATSNVGALAS